MSGVDRQLVEHIEVLAGTRPGASEQAAVRIADLQELLQLREPRAQEVSAAPTAEEHNTLLRDVKAVNQALRVVATILQGRILR